MSVAISQERPAISSCSSWTKSTPLVSGLVPCDAVCDGGVAEGASGAAPDWLCCATLAAHRKQQLAVIKIRRSLMDPPLSPITRVVNVIKRIFLSGAIYRPAPYQSSCRVRLFLLLFFASRERLNQGLVVAPPCAAFPAAEKGVSAVCVDYALAFQAARGSETVSGFFAGGHADLLSLVLLSTEHLERSYHGFIVTPFCGAVLGAEKRVAAALRDRALTLETVGGAEALLDGALRRGHADFLFLL